MYFGTIMAEATALHKFVNYYYYYYFLKIIIIITSEMHCFPTIL